jgi:hypothetical protein
VTCTDEDRDTGEATRMVGREEPAAGAGCSGAIGYRASRIVTSSSVRQAPPLLLPTACVQPFDAGISRGAKGSIGRRGHRLCHSFPRGGGEPKPTVEENQPEGHEIDAPVPLALPALLSRRTGSFDGPGRDENEEEEGVVERRRGARGRDRDR